jgi:hypothetical protein
MSSGQIEYHTDPESTAICWMEEVRGWAQWFHVLHTKAGRPWRLMRVCGL